MRSSGSYMRLRQRKPKRRLPLNDLLVEPALRVVGLSRVASLHSASTAPVVVIPVVRMWAGGHTVVLLVVAELHMLLWRAVVAPMVLVVS